MHIEIPLVKGYILAINILYKRLSGSFDFIAIGIFKNV